MTRKRREQERRRRMVLGVGIAAGSLAVLAVLVWAGGRWLSRVEPDEEHRHSDEATP